MDIPESLVRQMQTTRVPIRSVSSEKIAQLLEANGWLKSVAGEEDFNKAVKAIVAMYASGRGLFLTGEAGCGKTQLMRAMRKIMGVDGYHWFYCKEADDMAALRPSDSDALGGTVFLDDIGAEEIVKEYGNTIDIVGNFVQLYHYRGKGRFMATTNLNSQLINERYGGRILDRILEMCVVLKFNGESKRQRIVF